MNATAPEAVKKAFGGVMIHNGIRSRSRYKVMRTILVPPSPEAMMRFDPSIAT